MCPQLTISSWLHYLIRKGTNATSGNRVLCSAVSISPRWSQFPKAPTLGWTWVTDGFWFLQCGVCFSCVFSIPVSTTYLHFSLSLCIISILVCVRYMWLYRHVAKILKITIAHLTILPLITYQLRDFGSDCAYSFSDMTRFIHSCLLYWNRKNAL